MPSLDCVFPTISGSYSHTRHATLHVCARATTATRFWASPSGSVTARHTRRARRTPSHPVATRRARRTRRTPSHPSRPVTPVATRRCCPSLICHSFSRAAMGRLDLSASHPSRVSCNMKCHTHPDQAASDSEKWSSNSVAQPRGTFCPPQAPKHLGRQRKNFGKPLTIRLTMHENALNFHCRFEENLELS